jgi:hypothetical protein
LKVQGGEGQVSEERSGMRREVRNVRSVRVVGIDVKR